LLVERERQVLVVVSIRLCSSSFSSNTFFLSVVFGWLVASSCLEGIAC